MSFDFSYPGTLPSEKGWGPGWPECQTSKVVPLVVRGVKFVGGVREEVAELLERLIEESLRRGYIPKLDDPGCWAGACRATKRSDGTFTDRPSIHSWYLAVDINAPHNVFGGSTHQIPQKMADLFKEYGFRWLGPAIEDWMHFDFAGSVSDARDMLAKARRNELGEDRMTDAEKKKLEEAHNRATAILAGVRDFRDGTAPPADAHDARKDMYRVLTEAASRPAPGDHPHPEYAEKEHPHTGTATATAEFSLN